MKGLRRVFAWSIVVVMVGCGTSIFLDPRYGDPADDDDTGGTAGAASGTGGTGGATPAGTGGVAGVGGCRDNPGVGGMNICECIAGLTLWAGFDGWDSHCNTCMRAAQGQFDDGSTNPDAPCHDLWLQCDTTGGCSSVWSCLQNSDYRENPEAIPQCLLPADASPGREAFWALFRCVCPLCTDACVYACEMSCE